MSKIKPIAIKNRPRVGMQLIDSSQIAVASGISGDLRGRQVTILSEFAWQKACDEVDADVPWTLRRVNLLVDDVEFDASLFGKSVRIGAGELVITEEIDPCSSMDPQHQGLKAALTPAWRGGVYCNVVKPGHIKIGDRVEFS